MPELGYATPAGLSGSGDPGSSGLGARQDHVHPNPGGGPAGPYAPLASAFVTIGGDGSLTAERALTAGDGIGIADNGANSTVVLSASLAGTSGLQSSGGLAIADTIAGAGLAIASKVLSVATADTSLTINADSIQVRLAATSGLAVSSGLMVDDAIAGAGLTIANKVLAVGAGAGLTVNADDVALTTPGTLTVSSGNSATGSHTHAITTSANPGAAASILASTAGGGLTLQSLNIAASGLITFGTTNTITLGQIAANVLGMSSGDALECTYTSGWAGAGYHFDYNQSYAGQSFLELDRLSVRGVMNVYELLIHQIRATNGSIFVSNTGKASAVVDNGGGSYTITTETAHGFAVNDLIRAQRFTGSSTWQSDMTVTAVGSTTEFTATLRATYTAPAVGMEYVRLGSTSDTSRQGSIYLTADDTNAPYINILAGVAAFTDWGGTTKTRGRIGNLNGAFGISSNYYGIGLGDYAGGNYLRYETNGGFVLTAGAGAVAINSSGISIANTTGYGQVNSYQFLSAGALVGDLRSYTNAGTNYTGLITSPITGRDSHAQMLANAPAGKVSITSLYAHVDNSEIAGITLTGAAGNAAIALRTAAADRLTINNAGAVNIAQSLTVSAGLNVGTATGATTGQVRANGTVLCGNNGDSATFGTFANIGVRVVSTTDAAISLCNVNAGSSANARSWLIDCESTGVLNFYAANDAQTSFTSRVQIAHAGGMIIGNPTGGNKGDGTLNATAVYDDNTLLTCYIFDLYYDGKVSDAKLPYYRGQQLYGLAETRMYIEKERRLPWMPSLETFEQERNLGGLTTRLWEGQERQQIYVMELEQRITDLERQVAALRAA